MPIPKGLAEIIAASPPSKPPEDKLAAIRAAAVRAANLDREAADLEERLKLVKSQARELYEQTIPDMMSEVGIDKIGVPADGNRPAFDLNVVTEFSANIAAGWDEDRRRAAFDWLIANGHGDLIKTDLNASFGRDELELAKACALVIRREFGKEADVAEAVHPSTMKAWFKEAWTKHLPLPPLDLIGARVARVAKPKERKS